MNRIISVFIGLYALTVALLLSYQPVIPSYTPIKHDYRVTALLTFMQRHNFSQPYHIDTYIKEADKNQIQPQWLVVISFLESSGGRRYPLVTNNEWGYGSSTGLYRFHSVDEGIAYVSNQFAFNKHYAGKPLKQKILTYNSANPNYYPSFINLLNEIK